MAVKIYNEVPLENLEDHKRNKIVIDGNNAEQVDLLGQQLVEVKMENMDKDQQIQTLGEQVASMNIQLMLLRQELDKKGENVNES